MAANQLAPGVGQNQLTQQIAAGGQGVAPGTLQTAAAAMQNYLTLHQRDGVSLGLIDPATGQLTQTGYADMMRQTFGGGMPAGGPGGGQAAGGGAGYVPPGFKGAGGAGGAYGDWSGGTTYVGSLSPDPTGASVYQRNDGAPYYIESRSTGKRRSVNADGSDYQGPQPQ